MKILLRLGWFCRALPMVLSGLLVPSIVQAQNLETYYQQILETYPQQREASTGDPRAQLQVITQAGEAYQALGQFSAAATTYRDALKIARDLDDYALEEAIISKLVKVVSRLGDYQGVDFLTSQLEVVEGNPQREAIVLEQLGLAYQSTGNYDLAIEVYQQSLDIVETLGNQADQIEALGSLGNAQMGKRDYSSAIATFQTALTLARNLGQSALVQSTLIQLGSAHRFAGDDAAALDTLQQAVTLAQAEGDYNSEWIALRIIALLYSSLEDYDQALARHQQRLSLVQGIENEFQRSFLAALTSEDLSGTHLWLGNLGQAIELQETALEVYASLRQKTGQANVSEAQGLEKLGFLQAQAGDLSAAETSLNQAIELYDQQREAILATNNFLGSDPQQTSLFTYNASADIYRILQQILVAQNRTDEALVASEKGRARAYVDLLVSRLDTLPDSAATPPTLTEIRDIARRENTTLVQYTVLYEYSRLFKYRYGQEQPLTKAKSILIWVIDPKGNITFRQVELDRNLEELVKNARLYITDPRFRARFRNQAPLQALHQILIDPIADLLPQDPQQRVTFIPQDTLFLVPFVALEDRDGTFLIEKHTILTAPSIQVLDLARQAQERGATGQDPLIVGNPVMPALPQAFGQRNQPLSDLPGAEAEAIAIAQLLDTEPLIGAAATQTEVIAQMARSRLIHFATHGILDDFGGVLSSLALTPTPEDDGFLTAQEIANLPLNATELVVLSACDTGRGQITGDGVVGLSRSFITAGVPNVIVSLWAISDEATTTLMLHFYENLQQSDYATALREAMLATKAEYELPYAWAAFSLMGIDQS